MAKSDNLRKAKREKNDEFYTQYNDIAEELKHYREHFKDKVVYCNCDDPEWSNFFLYFKQNFKQLKLKKLITTHYNMDESNSYKLEYNGKNEIKTPLTGNGDFRSDECVEILKEADIVVTNPPFSLFRTFIAQLMETKKQFLVIGNMNAVTYKEFFPLLKKDLVFLGYTAPKTFKTPNGEEHNVFCKWYTNLDIDKRHDGLWHINGEFDKTKSHVYYEGFESLYPKYDNYDAIEVSKIKNIPIDYAGVMGVPITFLDKYNPDEFEIVWQAAGNTRASAPKDILKLLNYQQHKEDRGGCGVIDGRRKFPRVLIRNKQPISKAKKEAA